MSPLLLLAGAAAAWGALMMAEHATRPAPPPPPPPLPPPPTPQPGASVIPGLRLVWSPVAGPRVDLNYGETYAACVTLPFFVPNAIASDEAIAKRAAAEGFSNVIVWRDGTRPPGYPAVDCGFAIVQATYTGGSRAMDLPDGLSHVYVQRLA